MTSRAERLTLIASLYVSQAIPLGLLIVALPAILRQQGMGLEKIGFLGALALPFLLKFAWAPLVDRFGASGRGHYRSWIVPLQVACVLVVVALAAVEPPAGFTPLVFLAGAFMLLSATQDVATDGLAVRLLPYRDRGVGNGIQVGGYYAGQVLGGGLVLLLFDRVGWSAALLVIAGLLALPLVVVLRFREPRHVARAQPDKPGADFAALRRFFARPGALVWVLTIVLFRTGDAMALTMVNPLLVDRGLSLGEIGVLIGVVVSLAALSGSLVGGALVSRIGRETSLVSFGLLQAICLCGYLLPAGGYVDSFVLYPVVAISSFAGGMATAALYTNMMDRSDPDVAATDFTLQQSLCAIGPLIGATLSGVSAARLGYSGHFLLCAVVGLVGAVLVACALTSRSAAPLELSVD